MEFELDGELVIEANFNEVDWPSQAVKLPLEELKRAIDAGDSANRVVLLFSTRYNLHLLTGNGQTMVLRMVMAESARFSLADEGLTIIVNESKIPAQWYIKHARPLNLVVRFNGI